MLLQISNDTTSFNINNNVGTAINTLWFWISILEFLVILFLILRIIQINRKKKLAFSDVSEANKHFAKNTKIDMENIMDSINNSQVLYKELSKKCHPDRFVNTKEHDLAEKLFQEISLNKRNYQKLVELKVRAKSELQINF